MFGEENEKVRLWFALELRATGNVSVRPGKVEIYLIAINCFVDTRFAV